MGATEGFSRGYKQRPSVGAGSINFRCLELEPWPGILVPVPQHWYPLPLICELKMVVAASGSEKRIRISSVQEQALIPMTEVIFHICTQYRLTLKLGKCDTHWLL